MILEQEILQAAEILRAGGLVAVPTETVYGLAADAGNPQAIEKVFAAKGRPYSHPLIVHLVDYHQINDWAREVPAAINLLADAFWPGPLTIILKKQPRVPDIITGAQDTIALRLPRHPVMQALLRQFGSGLVAPSANRFTRISPTSAEAVQAELGAAVDMILDGGVCEVGLESTILDMSSERPRVLRPGMINPAEIAAVIHADVQLARQDYPGEVRAPGMHHVHYAPATPTELVTTEQLKNVAAEKLPAVYLHYNKIPFSLSEKITTVRMPADAAAYAHELYAVLRAQDGKQFQRIFVEVVPGSAEWDAIRDRLIKASSR